jgi:endonuclease/exonuclease/phosphatase family metal-dependent hydrolase
MLRCSKFGSVLRWFAAGLWLTVAVTGCITGCDLSAGSDGSSSGEGTLTIATWNLQALYDGVETGHEDSEYLAQAGWSEEKYRARLTALSQALGNMDTEGRSGYPDLIAFQEVENLGVLNTLAEESLAGKGYLWTSFAVQPGMSLGVGVISKFPLYNTKAHSMNEDSLAIPRPVLEVWFEKEGKPVVLLVCHWKSKLGDEAVTESQRRSAARVIQRRLREIAAEAPGTAVVITGDLNENHDEFYRNSGTILSALLPDDPVAAELADSFGGQEAGFLVLSQMKPPESRYFPNDETILYTPWDNELKKGSYNYQKTWETIDHILLNKVLFDGYDWEYEGAEALHREPFITAAGYPNTYNTRTGHGLSDHLPLVLKLRYTPHR